MTFPDQAVFYVEAQRGRDLSAVLDAIAEAVISTDRDAKGGIAAENVELTLPAGTVLQALSYRGSLDSWAEAIGRVANDSGRITARIEGESIELSSGDRVPLGRCKTLEYKK